MRRFRKTIRDPSTLKSHKRHESYDQTIDLHGLTVHEALTRLESLLATSSAHSILVIHGKGTGTLKSSVRRFLQTHRNVRQIQFGEIHNIHGGEGVTLIYLTT